MVPSAMVIAGEDTEEIMARLQDRMLSLEPRAGVDPVLVKAFHPIFELSFLRGGEYSSGVLDL